MIYGYLRVSTDEQDVNSQRQGVDSFALSKGWVIDKYITDEGVSGGKDPDKRNLGPMLNSLAKGDVVISSEISRLGRDLYMVMDILHFCMERECVIYTVKDRFVLGDDIQSKVLAFAFGLSAEIERQMIRQRTKEGLRQRMKMGVLLGRPVGRNGDTCSLDANKEQIIEQYKWGVPLRRLAENFNTTRSTLDRALGRWGVVQTKQYLIDQKRDRAEKRQLYKEDNYQIVNLDKEKCSQLIELDLTLPQIAEQFQEYTYEQVYDTILCDNELNALYRKHGQKKVKKERK